MTGIPLIIMFVVAVVAMIVAISKFKIHPFLSIMAVSLFFAFVAGVPLKEIPGDHRLRLLRDLHEHRHRHNPRRSDRHPARKDRRGAQDG